VEENFSQRDGNLSEVDNVFLKIEEFFQELGRKKLFLEEFI
jgi:hypothetical protein